MVFVPEALAIIFLKFLQSFDNDCFPPFEGRILFV